MSTIKDIQKVLYIAKESANALGIRISPVLRPSYPEENIAGVTPDGSCELHGMLIDIHASLARLVHSIDDLSLRVAI